MTTRSVTAIGALAEPIRRTLYDYVVERHQLVSREEVSEATSVPLSKVKFHLDRLVQEGLLEVEFRRLSGRTGPGAGRPAKLYRRAAEDFHASLPQRQYDVMGNILAAAVVDARGGGDLDAAIESAAYAKGSADAQRVCGAGACGSAVHADGDLAGASEVLAQLGYEPETEGQEVRLHNCPFDALANDHRELVCGTNTHYVQGVLDSCCSGTTNEAADPAGAPGLRACLDPAPGYCCVVVRPQPPQTSDDHVASN